MTTVRLDSVLLLSFAIVPALYHLYDACQEFWRWFSPSTLDFAELRWSDTDLCSHPVLLQSYSQTSNLKLDPFIDIALAYC